MHQTEWNGGMCTASYRKKYDGHGLAHSMNTIREGVIYVEVVNFTNDEVAIGYKT